MTHPPMIEESALRPLVERFYDRVRADPQIGPIFLGAVDDWDDHHARLTDFWSSIMLTTGRYKGNPLAMHLLHADAIQPDHFTRWLELWRITSDEMLPPQAAAAVQAKAARIAESFQLALHYRRPSAAII